jgi:hypothetical protein
MSHSSTASDGSYSSPSSPKIPATPKTVRRISDVANIILMRDQTKAHHIESCSGDPQTCPSLEGATVEKKVPMTHSDLFICSGAVDVVKLLRGSRICLFDKALSIGGNVLVDEQ